MKVRSRTKTTLILRDSPVAIWAIGAALLLTGSYLLFELARLRVSESPPGSVATMVLLAGGLVGTFTGAAFVFGIGATTYTFDKKVEHLVVQRRGLFTRSRWGCALPTIDSAVIESVLGLDGSPLFRVALVTASGRHIPLTPLYVSDREQHKRILLAIRQFLAKEGQRWWVNNVPEPPVDVDGWRRVTYFLAGSAIGLFVLAIGIAIAMIAAHTELQRYLPINATILETRVESKPGPDGKTMRRPVVVSRYMLRDRVYVNDVAPPFERRRDPQWAFEVVNQMKPGERYTMYYDPDHPNRPLLFKPTLTSWYVVATMPVVLLLVVGFSLRSWSRNVPTEPEVQQGAGVDDLVLIMP